MLKGDTKIIVHKWILSDNYYFTPVEWIGTNCLDRKIMSNSVSVSEVLYR